ncbi:hypothetical protein AMS68_001467 [Peltaster fructicola]|uniref:adenosine deaminase n=1 Tax=Peltaster fructicola TaxID=286661 RepID=A0A6H0XN82_9PEZI|nr:hypothetical protein AMS68_001467 [Peltaster fructicola]
MHLLTWVDLLTPPASGHRNGLAPQSRSHQGRGLPVYVNQIIVHAAQHDPDKPMQQASHIITACVVRTKEAIMPKLKRRRQQDSGKIDLHEDDSGIEKPMRLLRTRSHKQQPQATVSIMSNADDTVKAAFASVLAQTSDRPYQINRSKLLSHEEAESWDAKAKASASPSERQAQRIIFSIREHERIDPKQFGDLPTEAIPDPSTRDLGGRFLVNKDRIDQSKLFAISQRAPKGAHLHLHFNSEIKPEVLFPHARKLPNTMYVRTTGPLLSVADFATQEVVFCVQPETTPSANIYSIDYCPDFRETTNNPWMRWVDFQKHFPAEIVANVPDQLPGLSPAEIWAREKMIVTTQTAYHSRQTHNGAWACFNQGTRAFKGLVNYESVYRWYIGAAIDNMIKDHVMYAELRPMLLDKTIPGDDGVRLLNHKDQMQIIVEEVRRKQDELRARGEIDKFPFGLKIIYCTPRSIPRAKMELELQDCIKLKLQYPDLICGFDLVGAEDRPNHINFFADLLLAFTKTCNELNIKIPFMFHAGETLLDTGGSHNPDNSNLYDSLLLNAKRIGHGYALLKHPLLIEKYKAANIALELCPISNELLHLCGNAREHPFPALLAAGLHCSLNADNPSLFSSTLSHEFYQVMVGDTRMTIHGWRQLVEWSIEHSCLSDDERKEALRILARDWEEYCQWIVKEYGEYAAGLKELK